MPVPPATSRFGPVLGSGLGFVLVAGGFALGLGLTLRHADPATVLAPVDESGPVIAPIKVYIPFGDPMALPMAGGKIAMAGLTLAVEVPPEVLLTMQADIDARLPDLRAQVLDAAQGVAETLPQGTSLRDRLPERIRTLLNGAVGTDALPEPVQEVLLTEFMQQ